MCAALNTAEAFELGDVLRAVAAGLEIPVKVILIVLILGATALLGWLLAEFITERRLLKVSLPALLDSIRSNSPPLEGATSRAATIESNLEAYSPPATGRTGDLHEVISSSGLLRRQKEALIELTRHPSFNDAMLEALAIRLIEQEQARYDARIKLSELVARLGPMFGLLGTLIPLGPGIIALGQGDTFTLSTSLLTAFDTTIAGLSAAAAATVITAIRRAWYKDYMSILEALASCVLEVM